MFLIWIFPLIAVLTLMLASCFVIETTLVEIWLAEDSSGGFSAHDTFEDALYAPDCKQISSVHVEILNNGNYRIL